jgi:hypothetical protein
VFERCSLSPSSPPQETQVRRKGLEQAQKQLNMRILRNSVESKVENGQFATPINPQEPHVTHRVTYSDVENALAFALTEAAKAGRFDIVAQLVKELEARRPSSLPNVVAMDSARGRL